MTDEDRDRACLLAAEETRAEKARADAAEAERDRLLAVLHIISPTLTAVSSQLELAMCWGRELAEGDAEYVIAQVEDAARWEAIAVERNAECERLRAARDATSLEEESAIVMRDVDEPLTLSHLAGRIGAIESFGCGKCRS
jgi:hypothetical protein